MKCYMVQVVSIWENYELLGFFKDLDDAIEPINGHISESKYHLQKGDLKEYPSTMSSCFDCCVYDIVESRGIPIDEWCDDEDLQLRIRGYILDTESIIKELKEIDNSL